MYSSDSDPAIRKEIINALFVQGNARAMVAIARKETDPELKKQIVQRLSNMGSKDATEYLMELLQMRTLILLAALAPLCAQQPRLIDAKVETRAVTAGA